MNTRAMTTAMAAILLLMTWPRGAAADGDIRQAYKREFAFLKAEKSTLQKRIAALEQETGGKTASARSELDTLQGGIMSAALEAERLNEMMYDAERSVEGIEEGADALERTLEQAKAMLDQHGVDVATLTTASGSAAARTAAVGDDAASSDNATGPKPAATAAHKTEEAAAPPAEKEAVLQLKTLDAALGAATDLLSRVNTLRTEQGAYFGDSGDRVEGRMLRVGNVATYGLVEGSLGALAPAGAQRLKVWSAPGSSATAAALAQAQSPAHLNIFLYDGLDKSVDKPKEKTPLSVIESGGVIAWVIVGLGCFALLMIVLRTLLLLRSRANTGRLVAKLEPLLMSGNLEEAIKLCRQSRSAAGRVLRTTLQNLEREREHLEDIISEAILHETPTLDRFGSSIMVMAAVAPLLGLLGTVTGMISTFDVITEFGTGNPKLLSGGISEALVTTELGLIVAIPALLLGNMLSSWAETIKDDMDSAALRVTNVSTGIQVSRHAAVSLSSPAPQTPEPARV